MVNQPCTGEILLEHEEISPHPLSVTVVICTHNRPVLLERSLQALRRLDYPVFDLCVVDNAPNSDDAKILAARYGAEYSLVRMKGLSRARNAGARSARGDIIAYFDDDMLPHTDWLASLVAEFADEEVAAATGPMLPLTMADASRAELNVALQTLSWGPSRFHVDRRSSGWFERSNFGYLGDGNMAFRRSVFQQFRGFDERLGRGVTITGGEDHYAYFALIEMGYRIAYTPQAIVFHGVAPATREHNRHVISEATAYAAFLVWRHPRYSLRVVKFFIEGFLRKKHSWRAPPRPQQEPRATSLSLPEVAEAFIEGVRTCWRGLRPSNNVNAAGLAASQGGRDRVESDLE